MEPYIFLRFEGKIFLLTNAKARAKHSFSALKYLKPISLRHREVRKASGIAICTKKVKNKWSSNEKYVFYSGRHLCLFHWRARFRNLGTRKMINQSDKSLLCWPSIVWVTSPRDWSHEFKQVWIRGTSRRAKFWSLRLHFLTKMGSAHEGNLSPGLVAGTSRRD